MYSKIIVVGMVVLFATSANADMITGNTQDHYKMVITQKPRAFLASFNSLKTGKKLLVRLWPKTQSP